MAHQQGRVSAFVDISLTPIGYLMVLPVTHTIGVRGTLLVCGIILAAANLTPLLSGDVRKLTFLAGGPRAIEQSSGEHGPDGPAQDLAPPPAGGSAGRPGG